MIQAPSFQLSRKRTSKNHEIVQLQAVKAVFRPFLSGHNRDIGHAKCLTISLLSWDNRDSFLSRNRDSLLSRLSLDNYLTIRGLTLRMSRLCPDFIGPILLNINQLKRIGLVCVGTFGKTSKCSSTAAGIR